VRIVNSELTNGALDRRIALRKPKRPICVPRNSSSVDGLTERHLHAPPEKGCIRTNAEYLDRGAEFHRLAEATSEPTLKKRYADLAECYRLLAAERIRLIKEGKITGDE
jgi:hypothetical protein